MRRVLIVIVLLSFLMSGIYAQKLTTGILSGSNFSNLRSNNESGEWKSKMGSVTGIWFDYAFNQLLSIGTEFNYTSLYYQHIDYLQYYTGGIYNDMIYAPSPVYSQSWNFNFYRFPLYLKLSTPTKLRFEFTGGIYYSLLQLPQPANYGENTYPSAEFGTIFSVGFVYPLTNNINVFVKGRYITGNKEYISPYKGKNASTELVFGIGYTLFDKMNAKYSPFMLKDSSDSRFSIKYRAGANISWVEADQSSKSYVSKVGFTSGFAINYSLGKNAGIQTELLLEKRGYQLNDSTSSHYRYISKSNSQNTKYYTNSGIETTYFKVPILFELKSSDPFRVYVNTGPYFSTLINAKTTGYQITENKSDGYYYNKTKTIVNDNIEGIIAKSNWGWIVGGGVQIPLIYNWKLDIEARYQGSWSNILNLPATTPTTLDINSTRHMKNRSLAVLIGLHVPIY